MNVGLEDYDVDVRDIPADRKQRTPQGEYAHASQDTLVEELTTVAMRHEGPLSPEEIVQTLFDFADSYATYEGVTVDIERETDPDGEEVALATYPETDLLPSALGNWDAGIEPERYPTIGRDGDAE